MNFVREHRAWEAFTSFTKKLVRIAKFLYKRMCETQAHDWR